MQIQSHIIINFLSLALIFFASCTPRPQVQEASGTVQVQVADTDENQVYQLKVVNLEGITDLSTVSGQFAQFYFSPGAQENSLKGMAPKAQFIRTQSFFVPTDVISLQMSTMYYHLQNLARLDQIAGAEGVNQGPRAVGLETQVDDTNETTRRNNAFYNGQTDSMMFVPFDRQDLPISLNAGIIAHEHFHSLFFKILLKPALKAKKINSDLSKFSHVLIEPLPAPIVLIEPAIEPNAADPLTAQEVQLFNEILLRGLNEGLADFWAWLYTNDNEFMKYSLPRFKNERSLGLTENSKGRFETKNFILSRVQSAIQEEAQPRAQLTQYSYTIGTAYARFLRQWVQLQIQSDEARLKLSKDISAHSISLKKIEKENKADAARFVVEFIRNLYLKIEKLESNQLLLPEQLFLELTEVDSLKKFNFSNDKSTCLFLKSYLDFSQKPEALQCETVATDE